MHIRKQETALESDGSQVSQQLMSNLQRQTTVGPARLVGQNPGSSLRYQQLSRKKTFANSLLSITKIRPPDYNWCDEEPIFEQSIANKQLWVDSFFLYALVWAFGSILTNKAKYEFDRWLKQIFTKKEADLIEKLER